MSIEFGAFTSADHPWSLVDKAKNLEQLGFGSAWVEDEIHVPYSPPETVVPELFSCLALLAGHTRTLRIGSAVLDVAARSPVKMAQAIATLDSIAGGRLMIGVGSGEAINHEPYGIPTDHPFKRMEEAIRVIQLLLTSDPTRPVNFSGTYSNLTNAYIKFKPVSLPHPPLIISGLGPKAVTLAGQIGDGWISFAHTPRSYAETINGKFGQAVESSRRRLEQMITVFVVPVALSTDLKKAAQVGGEQAKDWLLLSPDNMKMITPEYAHGLGRQPHLVRAGGEWVRKLSEIKKKIPDEAVEGMYLHGSSEMIIEQIHAFRKAGVRVLILYPVPVDHFYTGVVIQPGEWLSVMKHFSSNIIPHFK